MFREANSSRSSRRTPSSRNRTMEHVQKVLSSGADAVQATAEAIEYQVPAVDIANRELVIAASREVQPYTKRVEAFRNHHVVPAVTAAQNVGLP